MENLFAYGSLRKKVQKIFGRILKEFRKKLLGYEVKDRDRRRIWTRELSNYHYRR
jgi:hypothetical protein